MKAKFGPQVRHIVLFGSVARGEDGQESDIDLLVEVRRRTTSLERRVYDNVAEISAENGELIVPIVLSTAERRRHVPRYLENAIRREGETIA